MSEQTPEQQKNANSPSAPPVHNNPLARLISHLNLTQLTLAVLVIVFVWQWLDSKYQLNQMQQTLASKLAEMEGGNKASQTLSQHNQELTRELGGKLSVLENKYAETQGQRTALESLYHDLSSSRDQMLLAEVEQMLLIASQQLQLAGNVKAALIAMQHADSRLQRLNRPALNEVRRAIQRDMDKLRALPEVDSAAINTRLDQLVALIDRMPLLQDIRIQQTASQPTPLADDGGWQKFLREIWQEAKSLVRIENTGRDELPLLSPSQAYFLRENLKLRLLSARLALLTHDETSFKHDVKTAQEWIRLYFDGKSAEVIQAGSVLLKLNASHIRLDLPDVNNSLETVRHYRASREKDAR